MPRLFLDTEFTDFRQPKLISFALASECGQEFYCELTDGWTEDDCSYFVLDTVLSLLEGGSRAMTRGQARQALSDWLASLPRADAQEPIRIVADIDLDLALLHQLLEAEPNQGVRNEPKLPLSWEKLVWPGLAMGQRHHELWIEQVGDHPKRHHALVDARALRASVLQTEADFRGWGP